jgi:HAD superfamily hydrolase (TIGR01490 family)
MTKEKTRVQRPFAVFDIDGTLIRWQLYHAVFDALAQDSGLDSEAYQNIRAARVRWEHRTHPESFKEYESLIVSAYQTILTSLTVAQFEAAVDKVFTEYKDQTYGYTRRLIEDLKQKNYMLFAISGSQTEIIARLAEYYGFDDYVGETLERIDGRFSGKVTATVHSKGAILQSLVKKHGLTFKDSLGIGDGLSDQGLLELVETPIAFNPEQKLYAVARAHGWKIVIERKNMVYELEPHNGSYQLKP